MWKVNEHVLVQSEAQGIRQLDPIANQWRELAAANQHIEERGLRAILPLLHSDNWLLISKDSIYSHPEQTQTPLSSPALDWLRQHPGRVGSTLLHNGHIALGGRSGGILVLNSRGETQWIIDKTLGFSRVLIVDITVDHQGNLWAAHGDRGITKIEVGAASTDFDNDLGISSTASLARYNGRLFATSHFGLYVLGSSAEEAGVFKLVNQQRLATHALVATGEELLFADASGLQTLRFDKGKMKLSHIDHQKDIGFVFQFSRPILQGKRVYANTDLGVIRLQRSRGIQEDYRHGRRSSHWQVSKLNNFNVYTHFIEPDRWGNLWAGSHSGSLYKISALEQWPDADVERVSDISVDNGGKVYVFEFEGDVIVSTAQGIYRIENGRPIADKRFSELYRQYGVIHHLKRASVGAAYWIVISDKLGKLTIAGNQLHFSPMERTNSQQIRDLLDDQGQSLWLAHTAGVSRIELDNRVNAKKFAPRVGLIIDKGSQAPLKHHVLEAAQPQPVLLSPGNRDLRFYVDLPHYSSLDKVQVRTKLEGLQQEWSNWSDDVYFDYPELGHGRYTWSLEAKYLDGTVLQSPAIDLAIAPYWYEKTWVRALGLTLALLLLTAAIYGLFHWRIIVLKRRNRILEIMVGERTKAITIKNTEITTLHERKTRFFYYLSHEFRTPLALIMGAQETILDAGQKPSSNWVHKLTKLAHTNSQRLNQLVNRLLDQQLAERGQLRLYVEQYSLEDFLQEVVTSFSFESQQRQVTISLVRVENLTLWFDREHMISIFYNIISNALKYSRDSGEYRRRN